MAVILVVVILSRQLQQVSTVTTMKQIIPWMVENESIHGQRGLYVRTITKFPEHL